MSVSIDRDVGLILAKVQDDLRRLRHTLSDRSEDVDLSAIESAISRTEESIRAHAEQVVSINNDRVSTLPAVVQTSRPPKLPSVQTRRAHQSKPSLSTTSPGQEVQLKFISKLLTQPSHTTTRQLLHDTYGVPTSMSHTQREVNLKRRSVISGSTIDPLTILPQRNRRDATLTPPPISSKDIQKGLLNLLERGLIPKSADIVLHPPLVQPRHAPLYKSSEQEYRSRPVDALEGGTTLAGIKFDQSIESLKKFPPSKQRLSPVLSSEKEESGRLAVKMVSLFSTGLSREGQESREGVVEDGQNAPAVFKVPIRGGAVVQNNEDFRAFKTLFSEDWNNITRLLKQVEQMAKDYAISIVFVDGKKLSDLASEYELEPTPKYNDLLPCILNSREVEHLLQMPGRRYKGQNGVHAAASKLQATYKMFVQRCKYLHYRRMKWAAGVIALAWVLYMQSCKIRKQLKEARQLQARNYRRRLLGLRDRWTTLQDSRRVVIHLPSKGYQHAIRQGLTHFPISQNLQLPRICDVLDPNVTVIYVCPTEIEEEIREYYEELLNGSMTKKEQERDQEQDQAWDRVHFVTPEHLNSFGHHKMSLSTLLKYSPKAIKHIKRLVGNRQAYIIPHIAGQDDLEISERLDIPLLGVEPSLVTLYSTHSGRQQLFRDGEVATPPNVREVYSYERLIEGLSVLIVNNLYVQKWLFKVDHYVEGKGIAFCSVVPHLDCYEWIVKESLRYGKKWKKQWAQEYARKKVAMELPIVLAMYAEPVNKKLFPTWSHYLQEFLAAGGSIEASPPSDSVTAITVDLLLEPTGSHRVLSTWDQIFSGPFQVWGGSIPQTSVDPTVLEDIIRGVVNAANARGLVGHLSVDLVTFIHPSTLQQVVWAVDIDFGPSDIVSMHSLLSRLGNVQTDNMNGRLATPLEGEERYAVVSARLMHSNLAMIQYNVFFKMCKAHLIVYNKKTCTGTVFTLVETSQRQYLGMICIQASLKEALSATSRALSAIHQEISTAQMQGVSNYPVVYKELEMITSQIEANETNQLTP